MQIHISQECGDTSTTLGATKGTLTLTGGFVCRGRALVPHLPFDSQLPDVATPTIKKFLMQQALVRLSGEYELGAYPDRQKTVTRSTWCDLTGPE